MHSPTQHENLRNTINGPQNKLSNEKNLGWLGYRDSNKPLGSLLLMAEILHHLIFYKALKNNGINYLSTGAGFQPSTVVTILESRKVFFVAQLVKLQACKLKHFPWTLHVGSLASP